MELRHLRYFVAVAEELSFTRAADRLHIGQPPLSQQIQALEAEIGVTLLDRTRRWVRLTEPGKLFLEDARRILALSANAMETARRADRGEVGQLSIGFTRAMPLTPIFPQVINAYRRQFPDVTLLLQEMSTMPQIAAIDDHSLDLGFLRPPETEISNSLVLTTLEQYPLSVIVPIRHRLAKKSKIFIEDLRDEEFVMFPRDEGTTVNPQIYRLCAEAGFEPKVVMEARQVSTIIGLIAAECGITILPNVFKRIGIEGVTFREIKTPGAITELVLASRSDERNPLVNAFLKIAVKVSEL